MEKKKNYGWIVSAVCFLVLFIGSYAQYQLSPLAHLIIPEFNLSPSQFSSVFTAAMIPGMCLSLVSGILCDKFGTKVCVNIACIVVAAALILRIWAGSYATLFLCMVCAGVGCTFLNSNIAKILGAWFAPEKIGTMIGITMSGSTLAMAIAMGTTAMFPSVKSAYIAAAVIAVIAAVCWIFLVKEKDEKGGAPVKSQPVLEGLKVIIRNRNIWLTAVCLMCLLGASVALSTFMPLALQSKMGMAATAAGGMSSIIMYGNLAGTIFGPMICQKIGKLKIHLILCAVIAGLGSAFAWLAPAGFLLMAALFLTGFFTSAAIPVLISVPIQLKDVGPTYAGVAGGFVSTIQLLGAVVLPTYVMTPIAGDNYHTLFLLAGSCMIVMILAVFGMPELMRKK